MDYARGLRREVCYGAEALTRDLAIPRLGDSKTWRFQDLAIQDLAIQDLAIQDLAIQDPAI
jgi:hypothetical protein